MTVYDINEARAARRDQGPDAWPFRLDGRTYYLPTELTRDAARALRKLDDNDLDGLLRILLGASQYNAFTRSGDVTVNDIAALLEAYGQATGLGMREAT